MKQRNRVFSMLLALALMFALIPSAAAAGDPAPAYQVGISTSRGFAVGARVIRGDENGRANWDSPLTRVEAVTMVVRLMGMEEEAQAAASDPSPFTDVPGWANGYVNVAHTYGVSNGVGEGRFDPSGVCDQQAFITMIYRLTHLEEGTDYTWATAVDDFLEDLRETKTINQTGYAGSIPYALWNLAPALESYFQNGGAFTRQAAVDVLYCMMNIIAGPEDESLGDILSAEYGMSDMLLFDHSIRRTAYGLRGETSVSIHNFAGQPGDVVLSIQDGMLYLEVPEGASAESYSVAIPDEETGDRQRVSCGEPIALPATSFTGQLIYMIQFIQCDENFYVTYTDGEWTISRWDLNSPWVEDYELIHAYRSGSYFKTMFREEDYARWNEEGAILPEIRALADELTAGKTTELEKADAICEWVATHIYYEYDEEGFPASGKIQGAAAVLERRTAVCAGFANLTLALMRAAGLKCYKETSNAYYISLGHEWNVAFLDGEWVVIDNTWDCPLSYNSPGGLYSGYLYNYHDSSYNSVWETPVDYLEPNAVRGEGGSPVHFDMDWTTFHARHWLDRRPIDIDNADTTILEEWLNKY